MGNLGSAIGNAVAQSMGGSSSGSGGHPAGGNKQVEQTAKANNINPYDFSDYVHEVKDALNMSANDNFTWQELQDLAKEFIMGY